MSENSSRRSSSQSHTAAAYVQPRPANELELEEAADRNSIEELSEDESDFEDDVLGTGEAELQPVRTQ